MSVIDDFRFTARALARAPVFTLITVVTLSVGIGASTAVFAVVNAVLIERLPYVDPQELAALRFQPPDAAGAEATVPSPALGAWTTQSRTLESVAAFAIGESAFSMPTGEPVRVPSAAVSLAFFDVLGVAGVQLGRPLAPQDFAPGAPRVAIVSHALWRDRLGAVQDLTTLRLRGITVVGVMPESFQFPDVIAPDVLTPLRLPPDTVVASIRAIARLHPGISPERAALELAQITERVSSTFPAAMAPYQRTGARLDVLPLQSHLASDVRFVLLAAFSVAGAILLIACANVSGLLLARMAARERELEIRLAIGATPRRVARLLLIESAMLAIAGASAALLAVQWSLAALRQSLVGTAPHVSAIALDGRVVAWTGFALLLSAALCAAIPIGRLLVRDRRWRVRLTSATGQPAGRQLAGRALVTVQVAGAVVLMVGAMLLLGTLWRLTNAEIGFNPGHLITMRVPAYTVRWPEPRAATLEDILSRVRQLPGVRSAGATTAFPLDGHGFGFTVQVDGQPAPPAGESGIGVDIVSPGYFDAMDVRIVAGREFDQRDTPNGPKVAIVNEAFVRWKKLSEAIGQRIAMAGDPQYAARSSPWSIEIIGVVGDVKDTNPGDDARPILYRPFTQAAPQIGWSTANIVVRTESDPAGMAGAVRQAIVNALPGATIYDVQPMEHRIAKLLAPERQRAIVFGLFGLTAVLLSATGLYGLLAYIVSQEKRELAIRVAIGATRARLAALVIARGVIPVAIGLVIGLVTAGLLTRTLSGLLYGVTPGEPGIYAGAAAIMIAVAAIASCVPARRAMHADPLTVLRSE